MIHNRWRTGNNDNLPVERLPALFICLVLIMAGCSKNEPDPAGFDYEVAEEPLSTDCFRVIFSQPMPGLRKNALGAHHGLDDVYPVDEVLLPQGPKMDRSYTIYQRHSKLNLRLHFQGAIGSEFEQMIKGEIPDEEWREIYRQRALIASASELKENIFLDIINEPNYKICRNGAGAGYLPWSNFFPMWKNAFDAIKAVDPDIKIAGPSIDESARAGGITTFRSQVGEFLGYCQENDCLPDVFTFHSESYRGPTNPEALTVVIRDILMKLGITSISGISCNEFAIKAGGIPRPCSPGIFFRYLPLLENAGLMDAALSGDSKTFGNATNTDQEIIALWHARRAYVNMPSERIMTISMVDVPGREEELDGLASWSEATGTGIVLAGNGLNVFPEDLCTVRFEDLPRSLGRFVNIVAARLPYSVDQKEAPLERPEIVLNKNYQLPDSRSMELELVILPHEGYIIKITKAV